MDFLNHIPPEVPDSTILASFDVTSLYTNIPHDLGLTAANFWIEKHRDLVDRRFKTDFLLSALQIVLEGNTFNFDGQTYEQMKGTAMRTKVAPTYANLVMGYLEYKLYEKVKEMSDLHVTEMNLCDQLRLAASQGQRETVHRLLQMGVRFEPDRDGRTALHYAALNGYVDVCKLLIEYHCDMDAQDILGFTPLHRAVSKGDLEVMSVLLIEGCDVDLQDKHGNAALHEGAWSGFSQSLELLVKHNCNVLISNRTGFTALHLAAQNGHNESCRVLLYANCNTDMKNNYGDTALHTAARYGHAGVTRILISARCCLHEQNKNGDTALHIAAALKRRKIAKLLVEARIDSYIKNKQGETAVEVARRKDHPEIILIITSFMKTHPKALLQPKRAVHFHTEMEPLGMDIMKCPDAEDAIIQEKQQDKPEKDKKFFFFKKKKVKEKDKDKVRVVANPTVGIPQQTCPPGTKAPVGKEHVHGFFSQYIPRNGLQYYRDLAGNVKQGPIGYAPVCQCLPVIKNIEKKVDVARESIYDHIDATQKILQNRMEQLDQKHMQQVFAVDRWTQQRLDAEEIACHQRIANRFEQARENLLNQYNKDIRTNVEEWLEEKMAVQGHCLNHHHDDSALPNNDVFTDIHENVQGRLFRTRSDETLSQSDNHSTRFRKKKFYESRQAAMQQIRGWQVPEYERRDNTRSNKLPLAASTPDHLKKVMDRCSNRATPQINEHSNVDVIGFGDSCDSKFQLGEQKDSGYSTKKDFFGPNGTCASSILRPEAPSQYWRNSQTPACSQGSRNVATLRHSTPKSKETNPIQTNSINQNQTNHPRMDQWTAENNHPSFLRGGSMHTTLSSRLQGTGMDPQMVSSASGGSCKAEDQYPSSPAFTTFGYPENVRTNSSLDPFTTPPKQTCSKYEQSFVDRSRLYTSPASPDGPPSNNSPRPNSFHGDSVGKNSYCNNSSTYDGVQSSQSSQFRDGVFNDRQPTRNKSDARPTSMYSFSDNSAKSNLNSLCMKQETPQTQTSVSEYSTLGVRNPCENVYVTVNNVHSETKENYPVRNAPVHGNFPSTKTVQQTSYSMNQMNSHQDFKNGNIVGKQHLSKSETHLENGLQNSHHHDDEQVLHESRPSFPKSAHGNNVQGSVQQTVFVSKEDSSSNPDSGYSSKIYGNRPNSVNPQSSMCTPSSSFSTDRSFSLQSSSPCNNATGSQDSVMVSSRNHFNNDFHCERLEEKTEQEWYQQQLQEAAQKLTGGMNRNVSQNNPISPTDNYNSGLSRNSHNWHTAPSYVRGSDV
ncbi:hypothetical protein ScPMuIL_012934 [Solemya velum]